MGVPRVWAIKRDHGRPPSKRGMHGDGLVVPRAGVLVVVSVERGGVRGHHRADYPDDKVPLPPATTGRPMRAQATQGIPRVRGAWG